MNMNAPSFVSILIAEDNDVSRQLMSAILEAKGYKVFGAIDGESAIKVIHERDIHLALVDVNMAPKGGLEFMKYLVSQGIDLPVILVTADTSADLLTQATGLGAAQVIQKPVEPQRLLQAIHRILTRRGINPAPLAVETRATRHAPEDLMQKVLEMAAENARSGKGGPFAALVVDEGGRILGTGESRHAGRIDPTAHAEVMAIRKAAEKLGRSDLAGCSLYCACHPTRVGQAVIESVGIGRVYYALTPQEMGLNVKTPQTAVYERAGQAEAGGILGDFIKT